ncbi:hypothetical protein K431DRAFT_288338 [Polychaeton citri CBS 116435]|uniref:Uncharacterized protein n=1 Tax=Polychaeton citri CBS 116435 TaxID=1314669 RepID=A0A9P4Q408_9PEZI|nr:hypothetical protein K431DRAFT_288338 [Polychaeton citri CBS 116435]
MAPVPVLHTESRLSPGSSSAIVRIDTTGTTSQQNGFLSSAGRKRSYEEISGSLDEEAYSRKYLASESSVFFRRKDSSPRTFLWRVLEDKKVVEVQCVDLVSPRRSDSREGLLVFQLVLPAKAIRGGVALADPVERDALDIFVLTEGNELLTFSLKRDLLTRESVPDGFDPHTCFRRFAPSSFSFRKPYRFRAVSARELLVSLHDGGLMYLVRDTNETGANWKESYFSEGGWGGTLKGLVPFRRQNTVRYGDIELDYNAAATMDKSPDGKYVWSVGLDHKIRAWNISNGKIELEMDLLQEEVEDSKKRRQQYLIPAEQGTLMQILPTPSDPAMIRIGSVLAGDTEKYSIVIHSPKTHEFKFYDSVFVPSSVEGDQVQLRDLQPRQRLIPPIDELLNTNIWHLEEFCVQPGPQWEGTQLWIRVRNGSLCKTYRLEFDLTSGRSELEHAWSSGWTIVDSGESTSERLKQRTDFPGDLDFPDEAGSSPSEKWLDFLFHPGRFTIASLETALNIYRKGRGLPSSKQLSKGLTTIEQPLKQRLVSAVTAQILVDLSTDGLPDFDRYQQEVQGQWQTYYALLTHLHNKRNESMSLAFSYDEGLAWGIGADYVAPIRACSTLELLIHNRATEDLNEHTTAEIVETLFPRDEAYFFSKFLATAKVFRRGLSASWQEEFRRAATSEALTSQQVATSSPKRVENLYSLTRLGDEITEDDFAALESDAQTFGGLGALDSNAILAVVEIIGSDANARGTDRGMELNKYGDKFVTAVAQETLQRNQDILLDLLALTVFMACDLEPDELSRSFKAPLVFDGIMSRLRQHELLLWLAEHVRNEPQKGKQTVEASASPVSGSLARGAEVPQVDGQKQVSLISMTLLESIFIGDFTSHASGVDNSMPQLLTQWALRWTYGPDLTDNWNGITSHCFANLLKYRNYELAITFAADFILDDWPWQHYLKGRLHVAMGNNEEAMSHFQAAAKGGLAEIKNIATHDTAHLLSAEDVTYIGHGQSKYWQHIAQLFESLKVYSFAIDAAREALRHLESESGLSKDALVELDRRKLQPDSPALDRIDNSLKEINILRFNRTVDEVVGRIFDSTLRCGRFQEAYGAVTKLNDRALRISNLRKLIEGCVQQDATPDLLSFPLEGDLAQQADAILLQLAKKRLASESSSSAPYHQILYAYRMQNGNFRGAAEILYQHLQQLRRSKKQHLLDPEDETLPNEFVLLINTLECCGEGEQWVLVSGTDKEVARGGKTRKLVTVEDVRRDYDKELDRRSDVLRGRFPIVGGRDGLMEVDVL